jgi:hypothetical protein
LQPFLALITPLGGDTQPPVGGGTPPGIWGPTDPRPTHPIAGWNPGTGTWPQPPYPDQGLPPFPSHPIVIPPGGQSPPRPDQSLPPFPTNPIVIPPGGAWPGSPPLVIWGPGDPRPQPPIAGIGPGGGFPGEGQPPGGGQKPPGFAGNLPAQDPTGSGWVYAFVPGYGWMWCQVPKPPTTEGPDQPHPDQTLPGDLEGEA